jgi:hypothetical protein
VRHASSSSNTTTLDRSAARGSVIGVALLLVSMISGPSCAATNAAPNATVSPAAAAAQSETKLPAEAASNAVATADANATAGPDVQSAQIAQRWGVEVTAIRLTASDHMIDYRYRVLDAARATDLFKRQIKPQLIHQKTGKVLGVPSTAKLGPLRNSNTPQAGKIYWMFFGNAGNLVKPGDKVTVVIGDFRVENLVVE